MCVCVSDYKEQVYTPMVTVESTTVVYVVQCLRHTLAHDASGRGFKLKHKQRQHSHIIISSSVKILL